MADDLDSIVKGAPLPGREAVGKNVAGTSPISAGATKPGDPLAHIPSSPSMIYLNMLVLEGSLRAQFLELRARRRHHSFFLMLLSFWTVGFGYALFFAPREDGRGVGGSVYWAVEVMERLCFMGGIVTAILVWATGIWDRGVRWPRRWFNISNRGLRVFNCKLVAMKRPWWAEALSSVGWFLTYGLFSKTGSSYRFVEPQVLREVDAELSLSGQGHPTLPMVVEDEERGGHEEDLAPGGDHVKLLLFAKPFSPNFRENWEIFRAEYWERENERRALIRVKLKERDRQLRKKRGGWMWWLPWYRVVPEQQPVAAGGPQHLGGEKGPLHARHASALGIEREHRRTRSSSVRRGSISSSRSPTPTIEVDEATGGVTRRGSTASNASDKRRKKLSTSTTRAKRPDSRSVTPDNSSPLAKESTSADGESSAPSTGLAVEEAGKRRRRKSLSRSPAPSVSSME